MLDHWGRYAGDEGGIVCRLDFTRETKKQVFASITPLRFDPDLPLAREIAATKSAASSA